MAKVIHGVVNADKTVTAYSGGGLESVVNETEDMDNGLVFHVGELLPNENELKKVVTPTTASIAKEPLYLHNSPEVTYGVGETALDFYVPMGERARARQLIVGDQWTVSNKMIDNLPADLTTAVNKYVSAQDGSKKLKYSATEPTGVRFIGQITRNKIQFGQPAITFVVKND